ncbi:CHAT domain-containing protein [Tirmania nivea]|nr:CHAT domain-containing protein [Tirmania nivea]
MKDIQLILEATLEDHPDRAVRLNNLSSHLNSRYERTGNLQDLEAAITVRATPEIHPERATFRYKRTGNLQDLEAAINHAEAAVEATKEDHNDRAVRRYKRAGNLQDLEGAINHAEAVVEETPEDHPARAPRLNNLSNHLRSRYAAINHAETAVKTTPEDHPDRAARLSNLSSNLSSRYERAGNLQDLEVAISHAETAVKATPEDHPYREIYLSNLGNHLSSRYERTGNLQDLEAAIDYTERAVKATPKDSLAHAARLLNNLSNCLSSRYVRTGDLQDVQAAINYVKTAVKTTPEDDPDRAARLSNLSSHLARKYRRVGNLEDVEAAIITNKDLSRASSLLHDAIHLIPPATSRSLEREDQQLILEKLTGFASLAAAVLLEAGRAPLEALRLQELARNITNGQLLHYRSDISDLMDQYPTLAKDFDSLRQELDSPFPFPEPSNMPKSKRLQIQTAIHQKIKLLKISMKYSSGFDKNLVSKISCLQNLRNIYLLNVTSLRSDAIVLTEEHVTSIALPHLSRASMFKYFSQSAVADVNEVKRELLEWLWKGAVEPVLRELGFYPKKVDPLPRIWWIGVGLMAKAPIHAAAKYKRAALQYSRSRQQQNQMSSALIVTMPTTPGTCPLSGVTKEAGEIKHSLLGLSIVEILERPIAERVLQELPGYSIAHFACHGVSLINPADSHLLLLKESISHNGLRTEEVDKLRVKDITALKLPAARLAYLSACSTANTASLELVDEVTHIVSSFHIA